MGKGPPSRASATSPGRSCARAAATLAIQRWGPLARTVLRRWRIRATLDFGNMVYLLVNNDFMQKTPQDSVDDFRDVYDFDKAFKVKPAFEVKE